jgi:hypothetical protein
MRNNLLDLNLQFFAEEAEGAEVSEVAEPTTTDVSEEESSSSEEVESTSQDVESNVQSDEENAKYAAARRRAEEELRQYKANEDAEYARRFGDYENPITHQPIRSKKDYFDALDAQEKLRRDQELQDKGIDPRMFEELVNRQVENNPVVQQAQMVMEESRQRNAEALLEEDMKVISSLNPNLKSLADVQSLPDFMQMAQMCQTNGIRLADAYKLVHFNDLMAGKTASAKQAALNTMNGTAHLNQTDGLANADNGEVEIPANEVAQWKRAFPHLSAAELRKKYNQVQNN